MGFSAHRAAALIQRHRPPYTGEPPKRAPLFVDRAYDGRNTAGRTCTRVSLTIAVGLFVSVAIALWALMMANSPQPRPGHGGTLNRALINASGCFSPLPVDPDRGDKHGDVDAVDLDH
jgi:hypothetical protein